MKSIKSKKQIYRDTFECLTNGKIPDNIFDAYIKDKDGYATLELQVWCANNCKGWCADWITGIGIIEAVEHLYNTSFENGNI